MRKTSQRDALRKGLKAVIDEADKPLLEATAEVMAENAAYPDEKEAILLIMIDADIKSKKFLSEQANAKVKRDAKRAVHLNGIATRNEVENLDRFASPAVANDIPA